MLGQISIVKLGQVWFFQFIFSFFWANCPRANCPWANCPATNKLHLNACAALSKSSSECMSKGSRCTQILLNANLSVHLLVNIRVLDVSGSLAPWTLAFESASPLQKYSKQWQQIFLYKAYCVLSSCVNYFAFVIGLQKFLSKQSLCLNIRA